MTSHLPKAPREQGDAGFRCGSLAAFPGLWHAFSTAAGGYAPGQIPGRTLPPGLAQAGGFPPDTPSIHLQQVHGGEVHVSESAMADGHPLPRADALVTRRHGLALTVQTADCVPLLLLDARAGVIGAAHMGWRGALAGIIQATVKAMTHLGAAPQETRAAVGPCICGCCFSVGDDVAGSFRRLDASLVEWSRGQAHVDLPGTAEHLLCRAGVPPHKVDQTGICTSCHAGRFYSHRRQNDHAGRLLSTIALKG